MAVNITSSLVKELRGKSGAGIMDCRNALVACNGNVEEAVDWLRKKGCATAARKAGRCASEGLIGVKVQGGPIGPMKGVILEVNSETDFVARNEIFQVFVADATQKALDHKVQSLDDVMDLVLSDGQAVSSAVLDLIARIGENIVLRRYASLDVSQGVLADYVHNSVVSGLGGIGVLVALEAPVETQDQYQKIESCGRQLAVHVAASSPQFLSIADVDSQTIEREKVILKEQAQSSGRPDNVVQKMVEGRLRQYFEDVVFEEQFFIFDPNRKISQVVQDLEKELGLPVRLKGFLRFALGEGIDKKSVDFASEVKAQLNP